MLKRRGPGNSKAAVFVSVAALVLLLCVGCGRGRVPVEGVITMDGKPLVKATVTLLSPDKTLPERTFRAETDGTGRYELKTADGDSAGAPPGQYHVFITSVQLPAKLDETTKVPPDPVPQKWRDGSQTFTVPDGGSTEANFLITSK